MILKSPTSPIICKSVQMCLQNSLFSCGFSLKALVFLTNCFCLPCIRVDRFGCATCYNENTRMMLTDLMVFVFVSSRAQYPISMKRSRSLPKDSFLIWCTSRLKTFGRSISGAWYRARTVSAAASTPSPFDSSRGSRWSYERGRRTRSRGERGSGEKLSNSSCCHT